METPWQDIPNTVPSACWQAEQLHAWGLGAGEPQSWGQTYGLCSKSAPWLQINHVCLPEQGQLSACLDALMRDVGRNLEAKNRDKFTQVWLS